MNKKFLIAWLAVFVVWMAGSFVVHGVLLAAGYADLAALYRTAEDSARYMPFMLGAHVVLSGAFVAVYRRGIETKPWLGQGIRYGVLIALLTAVPTYTIYYAVQPLPGMLVVKQIVFDTILCALLGATVAFLHRDGKGA
jgi:hypothetical protein